MPYRNENTMEISEPEEEKRSAEIMDNDFIPLDDLVYAPLHALAQSNHRLRAQIIEAIRAMGCSRQNGQE